MIDPRLRNVEKYTPPFPLNKFPRNFAVKLGRHIVYHLLTCSSRFEGQDWEEVFASIIGAQWKPSNVGLDDIVLEQCAWGAKTVKNKRPAEAKNLRLISGRNAPSYSYAIKDSTALEPNDLGNYILNIWNERVSAIRKKYKHLRTVVLIKSDDLRELAIFEFDTVRFEVEQYKWKWNKRNNLEGFSLSEEHRFTWQPHGSQFTIVEKVPIDRLALKIHAPANLQQDMEEILKSVKFDDSWIEVIK